MPRLTQAVATATRRAHDVADIARLRIAHEGTSCARSLAIKLGLAAALALGATACGGGQAPPEPSDGPGTSAWASDSITCSTNSDCETAEICENGVCQMNRCQQANYASTPPVSQYSYILLDRELVLATQNSALEVYASQAGGIGADSQFSQGLATTGVPSDVTGGNLTGARPESAAYLYNGSNSIVIVGGTGGASSTINLGWQGAWLAAGDINGDGVDDIVVAGGGQYAVCNAVKGSCTPGTATLTYNPDDVAVGDINGDGYGDMLFIGNNTLTVVDGGTQAVATYPVQESLSSIAAGDLDGDGIAEVMGVSGSNVYVYKLSGSDLTSAANTSVSGNALDLTYTRFANSPVIAVLTDGPAVLTFSYAQGAITAQSQASLQGGETRIGAADLDGLSPSMTLTTGPTLRAGPAVPIAVMGLPPYSATYSAGPSSSTIGNSTDTSTSTSMGSSTTVSASLNLGIAFPNLGVFSASVMAGLSWSHTSSMQTSVSTTLSSGASYSLTANPQLNGFDSAGVILAGGCFHEYDYSIDDPAGMLGQAAMGQTAAFFVPVDNRTTFWSSRRYNALAQALPAGTLPQITMPYKLGDVSSYPTSPSTLAGGAVAASDMVFPMTPTLQTSDVGAVSFNLNASQNTTNTTSTSISYGVTAFVGGSVGLWQIQASGGVTWGLDKSYSVTVGSSASFSGQVMQITDNPNTVGDESTLAAYSFQPYVYREHYTSPSGTPSGFYMLNFTAGQQ